MNWLESSHAPQAQLSRVALLYVLHVLLASIGLMFLYVPVWASGLGIACILWRLLVFIGKWSFPSSAQKTLVVIACCAAIAWQNRGGISLDLFVTMLLVGLSLKALEVYHNRHAQLFLYVSLLVLMTFLLYAQGFVPGVLAFLQVLLIASALVAVNSDHRLLAARGFMPLKTAGITLLFSVPLLVFLFVVMPRLSPLWVMPLQKQQAQTGMSEEMSPGDFNQLTKSSELVFRAGFSGTLPNRNTLYWRGVVLDEFDGRRWKNNCDCNFEWENTGKLLRSDSEPVYSILLEPQGKKWLYVLPAARIVDDAIWTNGENIFRYKQDMRERIRYDVFQQSTTGFPSGLSPTEQNRYTRLPRQGNPRSHALVESWRGQGFTEQQLLQKALDYYRQSFTYSLAPPLLGENSVDDFLFDSRKGFCEHFAGTLVFLLRAAGIPSRVVLGYQGGEINRDERYVTVRQFDAHAWAEYWQEDKGWVQVDPTAVIAPQRIEQGFAGAFPESEVLSTILGIRSFERGSIIGYLRVKLEYMDYVVGRWVLGYDPAAQQSLFKRWGIVSPWRLVGWFAGIFIGFFIVFLLYLQWRERHVRKEHPVTAAYRRLCESYSRLGISRLPAETPLQFSARMSGFDFPQTLLFCEISQQYDHWSYSAVPVVDEKNLIKKMQRLQWSIQWRGRTGFLSNR